MPGFVDDFVANYVRRDVDLTRIAYNAAHCDAYTLPRVVYNPTPAQSEQTNLKSALDSLWEAQLREIHQRQVQQCIELIPYLRARRNQIENQIFLLEKGGYEMWPDIKSLKDQLARNQERLNTRLRSYRILTGEDYAG